MRVQLRREELLLRELPAILPAPRGLLRAFHPVRRTTQHELAGGGGDNTFWPNRPLVVGCAPMKRPRFSREATAWNCALLIAPRRWE